MDTDIATADGAEAMSRSERIVFALEQASARVSLLLCWFSSLAVVAMMAATGYGVICRYVLNRPVAWTDEVGGYLLLGMVAFGVAEVSRKNAHIAVDILTVRLGTRAKLAFEVFADLVVIVFCAFLMVGAFRTAAFSRMVGMLSLGALHIPIWIPQASLVVGTFLMIFFSVLRLACRALRSGAPPKSDELRHVQID